jgi:putative ABC transport system permease protein
MLLGVLGVVALSVAALGMFNTLTVSMLERTHEVGMMKAVGMVSKEVKELFLAESMVMGILGGIMGLIMGILAGRLLSLAISFVSVSRGAGLINISYLPVDFIILIVILSLVVGFVTGMYPAYRATKISALDALRYE